MRHLGDITKINGAEIPLVDVITGGSPCQDLSIAGPFWKWLLKRISAQYERDATLGSLFDGIGGFPYLWEQINGKGSALWASEVEEFCIAVTKRRLGG